MTDTWCDKRCIILIIIIITAMDFTFFAKFTQNKTVTGKVYKAHGASKTKNSNFAKKISQRVNNR